MVFKHLPTKGLLVGKGKRVLYGGKDCLDSTNFIKNIITDARN